MDINYDVIACLWKYRYFKKAGIAIFADITKTETFFIKKIFVDSRKVKRIRGFVSKCISLYVFPYIAKFADFRWKIADVSGTQKVCHVTHIFFGSFLGKV